MSNGDEELPEDLDVPEQDFMTMEQAEADETVDVGEDPFAEDE